MEVFLVYKNDFCIEIETDIAFPYSNSIEFVSLLPQEINSMTSIDYLVEIRFRSPQTFYQTLFKLEWRKSPI